MVHTWYSSPTITVHLPQKKTSMVHGCRHKHTETNPDKIGPVWALLSRRNCCSQSKMEASNQAGCSLKHPPGHSCFHACTQDAKFEGATAWDLSVLPENTSLMSVLYLHVLSSLKSCTAFRKPARYFLLTWVGPESIPLMGSITVAALGRAVTGQILAEMVKPHIWHRRTSWELNSMSVRTAVLFEWCTTAASLQTCHMFKQSGSIYMFK